MKRQWLVLSFLITGICSCLISSTLAIYTTSNTFEIPLEIDYFAYGYLKYEFSSNKTCGYLVDPKGACTQGSVVYENSTGKISASGDAGALRKYTNVDRLASYDVNVHVMQNNPAELRDFGVYFNGSHVPHGQTGINAIGYVLRFTETGDLVITKEGYVNQGELDLHENDSILDASGFTIVSVADKEALEALQLDPNNLDIKISVTCGTDDSIQVIVFLNGIQINGEAITIYHNLNDHYKDGSGNNRMIGISSYGNHNVIVTDLSISNEQFRQ